MLTLLAVVTFTPPHFPMCDDLPGALDVIDVALHEGRFYEAMGELDRTSTCEDLDPSYRVTLLLRRAAIQDRKGLHHNTRPVRAALQAIMSAKVVADDAGPGARADVTLALAKYWYRAEMAEGEFLIAESFARDAISAYKQQGNRRGEASAVHALGLVHFQRGELADARQCFEESLVLEESFTDPRPELVADYYRHMAFVLDAEGAKADALDYYRESLRVRRDGGLFDASLFAAVSYANALIEAGRADEAGEFITDALSIAVSIGSPVGQMRARATRAKKLEALGEPEAARAEYEEVRALAETVASDSYRDWADAAIARLTPE